MAIPPQMPPDPMRTERPEPPFAAPGRTRISALATIAVLVIVVAVVLIAVL